MAELVRTARSYFFCGRRLRKGSHGDNRNRTDQNDRPGGTIKFTSENSHARFLRCGGHSYSRRSPRCSYPGDRLRFRGTLSTRRNGRTGSNLHALGLWFRTESARFRVGRTKSRMLQLSPVFIIHMHLAALKSNRYEAPLSLDRFDRNYLFIEEARK